MKSEITVRNCPTTFKFSCPQRWDALRPTVDDNVRHCDLCQRNVYFCEDDATTIAHAEAGDCIARIMPDASGLPVMYMGEPDVSRPRTVWTAEQRALLKQIHRERGIDDALKNADAPRKCPKCHYPAQNWRSECRVCGFAFGKVVQQQVDE